MVKYTDLPMDLADASLVILAEELKDSRILTTDFKDFTIYRWQNSQTFNFLLSQLNNLSFTQFFDEGFQRLRDNT